MCRWEALVYYVPSWRPVSRDTLLTNCQASLRRKWSHRSKAVGSEELLVSRCFDFSAVICRNWKKTTNLIIQVIRASTETAFGNDFKEQYTVYFDFFCVPTIYLDNYRFIPDVLLSFNAIPTCFAKFVVFNEFLNVL